jgi:hypothetical protein
MAPDLKVRYNLDNSNKRDQEPSIELKPVDKARKIVIQIEEKDLNQGLYSNLFYQQHNQANEDEQTGKKSLSSKFLG